MDTSAKTADYKVEAAKNLQEVLDSLSAIFEFIDDRVGWPSDLLEKGTFEIVFSLKFTPALDDHIKDDAVWHVLNECAKSNNFTTKYFMQRMRSYLREFTNKAPSSLVAILQVNRMAYMSFPRFTHSIDGDIKFSANLKKADQLALAKHNSNKLTLGLHDDFIFATTNIQATDHRLAIDRADRKFKYGLGVLNLVYRGYGVTKRFGYPNAPIGSFLSASSIFIVDRKRRKIGSYFSDNNFPRNFKRNFTYRDEFDDDASKFAARYIKQLNKIDFKDKFVQSVILFQEGLEAPSVDLALLKFWTGIEIICSKDSKEESKKIIERASSIFKNPTYIYKRLSFMQDFRNKIVHKGTSGDHALLCAQYGSIILAELIRFCLFNKHKFYHHEQIINYMSMPMNQADLNNMMNLAKKRLASLPK
ncbi:hypothetical protein HNR00_004356 [Methylorubrum rhodinum]|uniref:Apea-like HEPN domain-containing protein n=1 Tax=Methylorubrum rhodinum TaxID=29428 RepID=A0A840ZN38_9HYPH|nr:HEPN domain-containing protein [Methylorubrum rhodinum]MBB5759622.1 hypothetical protein [Methylorubrum rhodinum]